MCDPVEIRASVKDIKNRLYNRQSLPIVPLERRKLSKIIKEKRESLRDDEDKSNEDSCNKNVENSEKMNNVKSLVRNWSFKEPSVIFAQEKSLTPKLVNDIIVVKKMFDKDAPACSKIITKESVNTTEITNTSKSAINGEEGNNKECENSKESHEKELSVSKDSDFSEQNIVRDEQIKVISEIEPSSSVVKIEDTKKEPEDVIMNCRLSVKTGCCDWEGLMSTFKKHLSENHAYQSSLAESAIIKLAQFKTFTNTIQIRIFENVIFWCYHRVTHDNESSSIILYWTVVTLGCEADYYYEVEFFLSGNPCKRMIFTEWSVSPDEDIEHLYHCRRCVAIPLDVISKYFGIGDDLLNQIVCTTTIKKNVQK